MATETFGVTVTRLRAPVRAGENPLDKMAGERSTKKRRQTAPWSRREKLVEANTTEFYRIAV